MFENIGGKLKALAKVVCWMGIIASITFAIILLITAMESSQSESFMTYGFVLLITGPFLSWAGSFVTYGLGEMIDKLTEIEQNTRVRKTKSDTQTKLENLEKLRSQGLITEEEYQQVIAKYKGRGAL